MKFPRVIVKTGLFLIFIMILIFSPSKSYTTPLQEDEILLRAQTFVDKAWEEYHLAALSGTLASPEIQVQIESDFRTLSDLLLELRLQKQSGKMKETEKILEDIEKIAEKIIVESRREKP